jgi:sulfur relay protein TusB/DsrH
VTGAASHDRGAVPGCLHLIAGENAEALADCLAHSRAQDAVLFLDAGVQHLLRDRGADAPAALHYLQADLQARGLLDLALRRRVRIIDDAGFCALLAAHRHCLTWA